MVSTRTIRAVAPLQRQLQRTQVESSRRCIDSLRRTYTTPIQQHSRQVSHAQSRCYSTPPPTPTSPEAQIPPPRFTNLRSQLDNSVSRASSPSQQPKKRQSGRTLIYAATFLVIGMTLGTYSSSILAPAALPLPFSPEDLHHTNTLRQTMHALPLAVRLANDPNWESWDAYTSLPPESLPHRLTTGPMGGMRGIGYQHVFANRETGEFVVLVWLGKGLAGWPGVVHGGCIATVLDECLGRPALRWFDERSGVTARLEIQYKKPVLSGGWWLVRSKVEEDAEGSGEKRNKTWVNGTLEDLDGNVYVGARALYVVPKTIKLKSMGKF